MENKFNSFEKKDGMRQSAVFFCYVFAVFFAIALIIFLSLTIAVFADYTKALNSPACAGMDPTNGLGQFFDASKLQDLAKAEAIATYGQETVDSTPTLIESVKTTILSKYTLRNNVYYYNMLPILNYKFWLYVGFCVCALFLISIQIWAILRSKKMRYAEYYTLIVFLFVSLNLPSAILLICKGNER